MGFPWENETQRANIAWYLPRPKKSKYKGGMPLYCEKWLLLLAESLFGYKFGGPKVLQVFSGTNKIGDMVDLNPKVNPDYLCDIHELTRFIKGRKYDIILADPPYSNKESEEMYGTPPLHYAKWTSECIKLLSDDGIFIIYHRVKVPNPNPKEFETIKRVTIIGAPLHSIRIALFFRRRKKRWKPDRGYKIKEYDCLEDFKED